MRNIRDYVDLLNALDTISHLNQEAIANVSNPMEHANAMLRKNEFFTSVIAPNISRAKANSLNLTNENEISHRMAA